MSVSPAPLVAAVYCRISKDTEGEALAVARQEADCRALADRLGYRVGHVFIDNDLGASTRSRKLRPAYADMLDRTKNGEFAAVLAYSNSRLTRRPLELEGLITLHETTGVLIATCASGQDDLSTADGRMVARIKGSVDAAESERTGERVKRKHQELAQAGRPGGGPRPFGWQRDRVTVDPREATLIREAAEQVLSGASLRSIARGWNASNVSTPKGNDWTHKALRDMLRSPRLAGLRTLRGEQVYDASGDPVRGTWEPVLDTDTHERLVALMSSTRAPVAVRPGARVYLLTGLARCGVCSNALHGNKVRDRFYYACSTRADHALSVSGPGLDSLIEDLVLARLADVRLEAPAQDFHGEADLADVRERITETRQAYEQRVIKGSLYFPTIQALQAQEEALDVERQAWLAHTSGPTLSTVDRDTWEDMDTDQRRAVIDRLLEVVLIRPSRQRLGPRFDHERVEVLWRP